ncbi:peroxidase 25 isoform X1 [Cucurbita pepo subsp. pepo]|uniref:peroxidase 25 isoform X1 n=1 Tax=Cucurbita pepo subsp. pepo TaxID=3664 RepID=UPI000C9D44ED|nr:peroxidase 25 isoform X1 [Cucurbita pepo subsp. pepo]
MGQTKAIWWVFVGILATILPVKAQLAVGFYSKSCPRAESIVRSTVQSYYKADPTVAAGLLRLHFHDCFVQGCDGSVLIMDERAEINAGPNMGLRGFEVVDDAKAQLENLCPGVVSCADILALATRDAVDLSDGPSWSVPTGRRDGRVSMSFQAEDLPSPFEPIDVHIQKFAEKGLTEEDLVTLVGAHTIGRTDCQLFSYRLQNFTSTGNADPTINPSFLTQLRTLCPLDGDPFRGVAMDKDSQLRFDNSFFKNLVNGNGVLESDQRLWQHASTKDIVQRYAGNLRGLLGLRFNYEFKKAMVKLSSLDVKTGTQGEIRKLCSQFNNQ